MRHLLTYFCNFSVLALALSGCTSKNEQAAEALCFDRASGWVLQSNLVQTEESVKSPVFSEASDKVLFNFTPRKESDSYVASQIDAKKDILNRVKEFSRLEPAYMKECMTLTVAMLKECDSVTDVKACVDFHEPKIASLRQKYSNYEKKVAEDNKKNEALLDAVRKDDKAVVLEQVKSLPIKTEKEQKFLGEIIALALDTGSTQVASIWVGKKNPQLVKSAFQRILNSPNRQWTDAEIKTLDFLKPMISPKLVNELVGIEAAENLVTENNVSRLKVLMSMGLNINRKNQWDNDLSLVAVDEGKLAPLKLFLEKGVKIEHSDRLGRSLLHVAIDERNVPITKFLVKNGANPERPKYGTWGPTASSEALKSGNEELISALR